ncbi:cysteine hydrolase [Candidatus Gracilibacteria bacterium]|nr:cysteine hydrolase [Candidatus Gracilibacteria bacterium]
MRRLYNLEAQPNPIEIDAAHSAVIVTDMQRDFMERGGVAEAWGQNPEALRHIIPNIQRVVDAARKAAIEVIWLREGYSSDLSDVPISWKEDFAEGERIGDVGNGGWRFLIRGELGHGIIDELSPAPEEKIFDKASKNAFHRPEFNAYLQQALKRNLLWTGVTTNVCVGTSVRASNDHGYRSVVLADGTAAYNPAWHENELDTIRGQGKQNKRGIFGWVTTSENVIRSLEAA